MVSILIKLLIVASIVYMVFRVIKKASPTVRRISLVLFIVGLLAIEIYLRICGASPYFTVATSFENCFNHILEADSIKDNEVMICDSFGVNKMGPFGKTHSEPLLNSDGFRSLYEFSRSAIDSIHGRGRKAVLLVGDSYTYGLNADSGCSFASLLENYGKYGILNGGIPGTDAPQYSAVVNEYISSGKIRPDIVVVCFSRNDLMHFPDRKLTPGTPIIFHTNVGALYSYQGIRGEDTIYRTAKSAYQNIIDRYTIMGVIGEGWYTDLIGQSVLASRLVGLFRSKQEIKADKIIESIPLDPINTHVKSIKGDCDKAGIPVIFVLLPDKIFVSNKQSPLYEGVISIDPKLFSMDDFASGMDDHPVNSGHKKIAIEIDKILSKN